MDCKTTIEKMDGFRERILSPKETSQVKEHLADCERCRSTLARMEELDIGLRDVVRGVKPSSDFAARTVSKAEDLEIGRVGVGLGVWFPAAAAACLVAAVVVGFVLDRSTVPKEPVSVQDAPSDLAKTYPVGSAFVAGSDASVLPYRGPVKAEVAWDFIDNAPTLIVDAFPEGE